MSLALRSGRCGFILSCLANACLAQHGASPHGGRHYGPGPAPAAPAGGGGIGLGAVAGGYGYGYGFGGGGGTYQPGQIGLGFGIGAGPGGLALDAPQGLVVAGQEGPGGLMLSRPSTGRAQPPPVSAGARQSRPGRAEELVEVGDRSFRGGNYRRAEERYLLAAKANPDSPVPHIHLAQIAATRGEYNAAAAHLRGAVAAGGGAGWLMEAPDIQSMYGEPGDFARQIGRLESYLQTHPDDRNAWFVLGAQQYFSGRSQAATDAFLRLTDRTPDQALAAFVDASTVASRTQSHAGEAIHAATSPLE